MYVMWDEAQGEIIVELKSSIGGGCDGQCQGKGPRWCKADRKSKGIWGRQEGEGRRSESRMEKSQVLYLLMVGRAVSWGSREQPRAKLFGRVGGFEVQVLGWRLREGD